SKNQSARYRSPIDGYGAGTAFGFASHSAWHWLFACNSLASLNAMLKLFTPLLAALAGDELKRTTAQIKRTAIFGAVIGFFGILTLLFLCLAAFLALAQQYSGPIAALIMAGLSIILALLVLAVLKIQSAAEERKRQQQINADKAAL